MRRLICTVLVVSAPVLAASPTPQDFAHGLMLQPQANKPLQALKLPDKVYAGVTRADLGDLRVFNASGVVVPHALCPPKPAVTPPIHTRQLPIFVLRNARQGGTNGTQVRIKTAQRTRIQVLEPLAKQGEALSPSESASTQDNIAAYVIDARGLGGDIHAIRPRWRSANAASEVQVRVQASRNLQHWRTIVPSATLLQAQGRHGALKKNRIALPKGDYKYLRLERSSGGNPPRIEQVSAEVQQTAAERAPVTVTARAMATDINGADFLFDSKRLAPMYTARVPLPMQNMSIVATLDSRSRANAAWRQRWQGEIYSVAGLEQAGQWTPIRFPATTDRYWRLRVIQGADSLAGRRPGLNLGYHPLRLRFLAQGKAPFLLAYGSARVAPAAQGCDRLLGAVSKKEMSRMTGTASVTNAKAKVGGERALSARPEPTPVRLYVLWAVLIIGALVLVGMALSLLRRVRRD